ncbi:nitrate- and nitrite sensing domain-containing protein [Streptomyces sp. NPDC050161]|uniref:nitrate- and nitrite sensing domain-containing protein n=1 Tax=Streptomyces sp. NPDC050161 TaxID=3365604 RepID=UPI0037BD5A37
MRFRGKSIRRKIVALLLVPLVSLTVMWAFATYVTGRDANQLLEAGHVNHALGGPADEVVQDLQRERRQSLMYLADRRDADALPQLRQQTRATDESVARLRAGAEDPDVRDDLGGAARRAMRTAVQELSQLPALRGQIENNTVSRDEAFAAYNGMVDPHYDFIVALHALENVELDKQGRALVTVTRARESLSREDALMSAALASGSMSKSDLRTVSDEVAARRVLYRTSLPLLPPRDRGLFQDYWRSPATGELEGYENTAIGAGAAAAPKALNAERWDTEATRVLDDLQRMGKESTERFRSRVRPVALAVVAKAVIAGVLGFVALLVSLIVSFRIGRRHVKDLTRLRKAAHEVSGVRLPSVMRRLAAGEQVDVETEAPRLEFGQDETGQVGQALNTLQRAAIEAAVKQADMRRGVSEVFVNLARRSQVLLHRQLTLLDAMERRTEDTDELADLFRLDHLTTRMRRHAEGLVILSGAAPSRQWRKPVQLMDVVRAAVAEVEDYERIEVRRLPRLAVDGPAVSDLTHLIAELLENATVFSPPHTAVQVVGERVANGFTVEIHDRGLGIAPDLLLDANLRLAETPEFELSDTDRLGLFVVSRLAQRQAVRVSLQPSPYGGTTAVVFIPGTILTESGPGGRGDRETARVEPAEGPDLPALEPVTGKLGAPSQMLGRRASRVPALDGPVELEPPLGADELDRLDDEDALFRGRSRGRGRRGAAAPTGPTPSPGIAPVPHLAAAEQHQQAGDRTPGSGPAPLPRRRPRPPVLVSDHGRTVEDGETRARSGGPARPEPEPADRAPRAADEGGGRTPDGPAPDPQAGGPPRQRPPATTPGGLPRRVRQASLAPQLKADPAQQAEEERRAAQADDDRDAEAVRARMASLQRGWQRGRRDNEESAAADGSTDDHATQDGSADGSAAREGDGGGTTAPGTTPGGDGP